MYRRFGEKVKYIDNEFKLEIIKLKLPNIDLRIMLSILIFFPTVNRQMPTLITVVLGLKEKETRCLCAVKIEALLNGVAYTDKFSFVSNPLDVQFLSRQWYYTVLLNMSITVIKK